MKKKTLLAVLSVLLIASVSCAVYVYHGGIVREKQVMAYRIMGELCGPLPFYAGIYINREIERYSPTKQEGLHRVFIRMTTER